MTVTLSIFTPPKDDIESGKLLAAEMPTGRAWDKKNVAGEDINGLVRGISSPFMQVQQKIFELAKEFDINKTQNLLSDWQTSVGLPDSCVFEFGTLTEQREQVIQRLRKTPVVSLAELQAYIQAFFESHTITLLAAGASASFEYTFEMSFSDGINGRFVILAYITTGGDTDLLECLLRGIIPANVLTIIEEV